ncbi:MAG: hypothetical protein AABW65_02080 [Nanoarchaeota archaeon]
MVNKIIGYVLAVLGIVSFILSSGGAQKALSLTLPKALSSTALLVVGLVLVIIGIFLIVKGSKQKQPSEVPIYQGKNIVGYRRV